MLKMQKKKKLFISTFLTNKNCNTLALSEKKKLAVNLLNFSENFSLEILNNLNSLKMCLRNVLL
jgi:hypothetical protein